MRKPKRHMPETNLHLDSTLWGLASVFEPHSDLEVLRMRDFWFSRYSGFALLLATLPWASQAQTATRPLKDTGITWSGHASSGNATTCDASHPTGQDCHYERYADAAAGQLVKKNVAAQGLTSPRSPTAAPSCAPVPPWAAAPTTGPARKQRHRPGLGSQNHQRTAQPEPHLLLVQTPKLRGLHRTHRVPADTPERAGTLTPQTVAPVHMQRADRLQALLVSSYLSNLSPVRNHRARAEVWERHPQFSSINFQKC